MNENKEIYEKIRASAEPITPPEKLSPERIKERLKDRPKQHKASFPYRAYAAAAAAVILFVTAFGTTAHLAHVHIRENAETPAVVESTPSDGKTSSDGKTAKAPASPDAGDSTAPGITESISEELLTRGNEAISAILTPAESYDSIKSAFRSAYDTWQAEMVYYDMDIVKESAMESEAVPRQAAAERDEAASDLAGGFATNEAAKSSADHSDTNLRTEGVDEADFVKTDGDCIFIADEEKGVTVLRANDGAPEVLTHVKPQAEGGVFMIRDIFLRDQTLVVLGNAYTSSLSEEENRGSSPAAADVLYVNEKYETRAYLYDLTDKGAPKEKGCTIMDGDYFTSRIKDGTLFLFTRYQNQSLMPMWSRYGVYAEDVYIPTNGVSDEKEFNLTLPEMNGEVPEASCFYLPKEISDTDSLCMASVPLSGKGEITDQKVILGYTRDIYVSGDSIFLEKSDYRNNTSTTTIIRLSYTEAKDHFLGKGTCTVPGELNDAFAIDEDQKGYLRVATTVNNWSGEGGVRRDNRLYIYDESLKEVGSLTGLAKNEDIKSARYIGDYLYLVTFRNTDPLFTIDLSDPADPKVVGELHMPGFSEYLHPFGEGLLFGLGYQADETTGGTEGLKLSMYDISDPARVTIVANAYLPEEDYAEALSNYRALTVTNGCFGFGAVDWGGYSEGGTWYYLFSYENGAFHNRLKQALPRQNYDGARGIRIKDVFYVIGDQSITAYRIPEDLSASLEKLSETGF